MIKDKWLRTNIVAVKAMVKAGYNRTKIYNISRNQGWGARKTDVLETLRYYSGIRERARSVWKSTPRKYTPSSIRAPKAAYKHKKQHILEIDIIRFNEQTGHYESWSPHYGIDKLKSREEIEEDIEAFTHRYGYKYVHIMDVRVFK